MAAKNHRVLFADITRQWGQGFKCVSLNSPTHPLACLTAYPVVQVGNILIPVGQLGLQ